MKNDQVSALKDRPLYGETDNNKSANKAISAGGKSPKVNVTVMGEQC